MKVEAAKLSGPKDVEVRQRSDLAGTAGDATRAVRVGRLNWPIL
jgi:hypothetical protein